MYDRAYSHCPLKKRPIKWDFEAQVADESPVEDEPENLSLKPQDIRINYPLVESNPHPHYNVLCPVSYNTSQHHTHQQPNPWIKSYDQQQIFSPQSPPPCPSSYPVMRILENQNHEILKVTPGGNNRYHCPTCSKSYSTYSGLSKHSQFHCNANQSKSFICKFCDKVYVSLGALKMHIRTHTLPCKCTLCGKAFSRPWLLQGHIRTHTGEKPFNCQHCNRAFADRSNLRAHLQTHSELKKYSCGKCGKSFSRVSLLTKHEGSCC